MENNGKNNVKNNENNEVARRLGVLDRRTRRAAMKKPAHEQGRVTLARTRD